MIKTDVVLGGLPQGTLVTFKISDTIWGSGHICGMLDSECAAFYIVSIHSLSHDWPYSTMVVFAHQLELVDVENIPPIN